MESPAASRPSPLLSLLAFLGLSLGAALLGGLLTARSVTTWYRTLRKPPWNPPDWLFGPVWTVLYLQIAIAGWIVRMGIEKRPGRASQGGLALAAWGIQLALNVGWSATFFWRRSIGGGVAVIACLWAAIATTAYLASRVSRAAGILLLPYLAWTTFAAALNIEIWRLNKR